MTVDVTVSGFCLDGVSAWPNLSLLGENGWTAGADDSPTTELSHKQTMVSSVYSYVQRRSSVSMIFQVCAAEMGSMRRGGQPPR